MHFVGIGSRAQHKTNTKHVHRVVDADVAILEISVSYLQQRIALCDEAGEEIWEDLIFVILEVNVDPVVQVRHEKEIVEVVADRRGL